MRGKSHPFLLTLAGIFGALLCAGAWAAAAPDGGTVTAVRIWGGPDSTRVIFDLSAPLAYQLFQLDKPDRVVIDLDHGVFGKGLGVGSGKGVVRDVRTGIFQGKARVVLDLDGPAHPKSFLLPPAGQYGYRLVVDLGTPSNRPSAIVRTIDADLARGKPRPVVIAVDAGHGGDDPGARGAGGTLEKNATLGVAKDLAKLIDAQPGMHAVLTRKGDYFVPLEKRFQIAREHKADLFVSIHANSCPDYCDARGASVWVLSPRGKESEAGRWLAKSENASDLIGGVSLDDKSHMLASVLLDLSQGASMHAAHEVGGDILTALGKVGPLYRDTVQGANFVVLRSPDVPSILVEMAFISNRADERRLDSNQDRLHLAGAILTGVKQYFEATPPPGTWFAEQRNRRLDRDRGTTGLARATRARADAGAPGTALPAGAASAPDTAAVAAKAAPVMVASAKPAQAGATRASADGNIQDLHKVARGETLSGIAEQYGVTLGALRSVNTGKIPSGGGIQAGQVLLIPNS